MVQALANGISLPWLTHNLVTVVCIAIRTVFCFLNFGFFFQVSTLFGLALLYSVAHCTLHKLATPVTKDPAELVVPGLFAASVPSQQICASDTTSSYDYVLVTAYTHSSPPD